MSTSVPPPPPSGPPATPGPTDTFFDGIRRAGIVRSDDRWIGGVAGGLSLRAGVDPLVGRAIFVLAAFLGGIGLIAYGLGWALLPEQRDGRIHLQELFRGNFDVAVVGAIVVTLAGLSSAGVRPWWGVWGGDGWSGVVWVTVLVLVVVVIASASRSSRDGARPYPPPPAAPPTDLPTDPAAAPGTTAPSATSTEAPNPGDTMPPAPTPPPAPTAPGTTSGAASGTAFSTTSGAAPGAASGAASGPTATAHGGQARPAAYGPSTTAYGPTATAYGPGAGSSGYGGGYGGGHGRGYGGYPAQRPPAPPKPVVRGAGAAATGVVVGLGLLTFAGLMVADRYAGWDGPVLLTAGAVTVVLAGLAIVLAGARGRSSGGLGAVAVLTSLVLLPAAALQPNVWNVDAVVAGVGEIRQTPTSVADAERGFTVGAGEARIDLTELPTTRGDLVEVPIAAGAGDVTVTMPRDGAYTASVRVFAGEVRWLGERVRSGVGNQFVELESPAVRDGAEPRMHLQITVGAGEVTVVEAGR